MLLIFSIILSFILIIFFLIIYRKRIRNFFFDDFKKQILKENEEILTKAENNISSITDDISQTVNDLKNTVRDLEKDRERKFGEVTNHLHNVNTGLKNINDVTNKLHNALSNQKVRGQWGERMAEDIIKLIGLQENINYFKQSLDSNGRRPDFTFVLPNGLKMNLDAKFPLNNYLLYMNADNDSDKSNYLKKFLKDIRERIKEVTVKDYINPLENTVDFIVVFIPNEQVLYFVMENDPTFMQYALENKVVVCSPWSLYIILSVVNQACQIFRLEKSMVKALSIISGFSKEFTSYQEEDDKVDKKLSELIKIRDAVRGVRTRQLEKYLTQLNNLMNKE